MYVLLAACVFAAGCGGESDGGDSALIPESQKPDGENGTPGTIAGRVFKGPVDGARVRARLLDTYGGPGQVLAEIDSSIDGYFSFDDLPIDRPLLLEAADGIFEDEATGIEIDIASEDAVLYCALPPAVAGFEPDDVAVTPLTTIAYSYARVLIAQGVALEEALGDAAILVAGHFGLEDILRARCVDLCASPVPGGTTARDIEYAALLAGLSRAAFELTAGPKVLALVDALNDDVADGSFDGYGTIGRISVAGADLPVDFTTGGLPDGIEDFIDGPRNKSGVRTSALNEMLATIKDRDHGFARRPRVTEVSPNSGRTGSPIEIVVSGIGFVPGTIVDIDDAEIDEVQFYSDSALTVRATFDRPGLKKLLVRGPDGLFSVSDALFTAYLPLNISANNPPDAIVGEFYEYIFAATGGSGSALWLAEQGELPAGLALSFDGRLNGIATEQEIAIVHITATDKVYPSNVATATFVISAIELPLSIFAISPDRAAVNGGVVVTAAGQKFREGMAMQLGGAPVPIVLVSDSTFTFVAPAHEEGFYDVRIANPSGETFTLREGLEYYDPFNVVVRNVDPPRARFGEETDVTIYGSNLDSVTFVAIGDYWLADVDVVDDTTVTGTVTVPCAGIFDVVAHSALASSDPFEGGFAAHATPLVSSGVTATSPCVAGSGDRFGVAFRCESGAPDEIFFQLFDSAGVPLAPPHQVTADLDLDLEPSIAWSGSTFGVVWASDGPIDYAVYFARFNAEGVFDDELGVVALVDGIAQPRRPHIVWDGSSFAVFYDGGASQIYYTQISADGVVTPGLDQVQVTPGGNDCRFARAAPAGAGFALAWQENVSSQWRIKLALVSGEGVIDPVFGILSVEAGTGNATLPSVAVSGDTIAVTWLSNVGGAEACAKAAVVGMDGTGFAAVAFEDLPGACGRPRVAADDGEFAALLRVELPGATEICRLRFAGNGAQIGPLTRLTDVLRYCETPDVASAGDFLWSAWSERALDGSADIGVYFAAVSPTDVCEVRREGIEIAYGAASVHAPALCCSGTGSAAAYSRSDPGDFDVFLLRLDADGEPVGAETTVVSRTGDQREPSIAFSGTNYCVAYSDAAGVYITFVSLGGIVDAGIGELTVSLDASSPCVRWTGSHFAVVYIHTAPEGDTIRLKRYSSAGVYDSALGEVVLTPEPSLELFRPAAAVDGGECGVVYCDTAADAVYFLRVTAEGALDTGIGANAVLQGANVGLLASAAICAGDGCFYVTSPGDDGLYIVRVNTLGVPDIDFGVKKIIDSGNVLAPSVVCYRTTLGLAASIYEDDTCDLFFIRLDFNGAPKTPLERISRWADYTECKGSATVRYGPSGWTFAWSEGYDTVYLKIRD